MSKIIYKPSDAGKIILNKRGSKIRIRKYHMTKEEMKRNRERWLLDVLEVDKRTMEKVNKRFFNPYRKGIYYYQIQALFLLGAGSWHSFPRILSKIKSYMTDIKLPEDSMFDNTWEKYRGKSNREQSITCKDYIGRIQENFLFFQRLGKLNPYGYKLHQVGGAVDIKKIFKKGIERGALFYRLSTYDSISNAYPIRNYKGKKCISSSKFIGSTL